MCRYSSQDEAVLAHIRRGQSLIEQQGDYRGAEGEYQQALEVLTRTYYKIIVGFCVNILRCYVLHAREVAPDVAQEVFCAAWRSLPRFRHESSIRTWLFRIARNKCIDALQGFGYRSQIDEIEEKIYENVIDPSLT